jgi:hypothetical protein
MIAMPGAAVEVVAFLQSLVARHEYAANCALHHVVDLPGPLFVGLRSFRQAHQYPYHQSDAQQENQYAYTEHGWLV